MTKMEFLEGGGSILRADFGKSRGEWGPWVKSCLGGGGVWIISGTTQCCSNNYYNIV